MMLLHSLIHVDMTPMMHTRQRSDRNVIRWHHRCYIAMMMMDWNLGAIDTYYDTNARVSYNTSFNGGDVVLLHTW